MSRGCLYIAMGEDYIAEAVLSAESLTEHNPNTPIAIITDQPVNSDEFDHVIRVDDPRYDLGDCLIYKSASPFDRTLYLDTDIYVNGDITEIFEMLDEFDVAAATDTTGWMLQHYEFDHPVFEVPEAFPMYNGGVIAYKQNDTVQRFLDRWEAKYLEHYDNGVVHNQPSLRHALYHSDVRLLTLPPEYNCLYRESQKLTSTVKLFHGRLFEFDNAGAGMEMPLDNAIKHINATTTPRVSIPIGNGSFTMIPSYPPPLFVDVVQETSNVFTAIPVLLRRDGIKETISKLVQQVRS